MYLSPQVLQLLKLRKLKDKYTRLGASSLAANYLITNTYNTLVKAAPQDMFALGVTLVYLITGTVPFLEATFDDPLYKMV